jgi:hypothetical protein
MPRKSTLVLGMLVLAAALLAGCAGSGSRSAKANKAYPAWVLNPDYPGHIGVVGSAPRQDIGGRDAQYRVATLKARQELAQMIRVHVESTSRTKIEDRRGSATRDLDMETRLRSIEALSLDRAHVINEWVDPESGDLYLFLVTPK